MTTKKLNIKEWISTIGLLIALFGWGVSTGIFISEIRTLRGLVKELQEFNEKQDELNENYTNLFECFDVVVTVKPKTEPQP